MPANKKQLSSSTRSWQCGKYNIYTLRSKLVSVRENQRITEENICQVSTWTGINRNESLYFNKCKILDKNFRSNSLYLLRRLVTYKFWLTCKMFSVLSIAPKLYTLVQLFSSIVKYWETKTGLTQFHSYFTLDT